MNAGEGKIAVVGLGGMGSGIARRLLSQGFPVVVYNRDAAKAAPLAKAGATVATSLDEVARDARTVVLSLSDEHAVLEVLDGGLVAGLSPGALLLDTTTVSPEFAVAISERLAALGILRVEICVVGNPAMAASGELRVFTAGDRAVVAKANPVLSAISRHLSHVGRPGAATTLKLAFNILLGAQVTALAEAVALGESAGMDRDVLLDKITGSGFSSAVLAFRAEFMRKRSYTPAAFRTQLMEKDLRLACTSAAEAGIELPIAENARSIFADAVLAGHGASDVSVVLDLATALRRDNESGGRRQRVRRPASMNSDTAVGDQASPARLFQVANGFCTAKILLTALDIGLFELLERGGCTEAEIRTALTLSPRASWHFLSSLVWLGFLRREGKTYYNTTVASQHLVSGRSGYMGGFLSRANSLFYPAWDRFEEALRTGKPVTSQSEGSTAYERMTEDQEQLRSFLGMMDAINAPLGPELAAVLDWRSYRSVLDCGGARGNLVANILKVHGHLEAGVFDRPRVQPIFDEHMESLGLSGSVRFHPGDFFSDPLPPAEVLIFGHVLHDWSPGQRRELVRKAYEAVAPGGMLVIYDPMVDDELAKPMNLVISLDLLLTTEEGSEYPAADCLEWMADAGFGRITTRPLGDNDTLVVGHKPGVRPGVRS